MLLTTTTVRIERPAAGDPYEVVTRSVVAEGVTAHIGSPSGAEVDRGGQQERIDAVLLAEPGIDLVHTDLIFDETLEVRYRVAWVDQRQGLGLSHTKAGLVRWAGGASG